MDRGSVRDAVFMIVREHCETRSELFQVVDAARLLAAFPRFLQGRQQHRGENRDDRNNYQKLDQGEMVSFHANLLNLLQKRRVKSNFG